MSQNSPSENLQKIIDEISDLPTLPAVITQVTRMLQNPKVAANEVGLAIASDQSLASKILKVVNSPFYGFPSRIKTITHAIVILGFNAVKATALSTSVFSALGKESKITRFDRKQFWKHSLGTGAAAKALAKLTNMKDTEEAFLEGLMHDIGKIILDEFHHEQFEEIIALAENKNCLLIEAERDILGGLSHCDIGSYLANRWNLNEEFVAVIENHHAPSSAHAHYELTCIVHVANGLVRCLDYGNSGDNLVSQIDSSAWNLLKLSTNDLPNILDEVDLEMKKSEVFFNLLD